jgi:hypothetical protein
MLTRSKPVLRVFGVLLVVAVVYGILVLPARAGKVVIDECLLVLVKETEFGDGQSFDFTADFSVGSDLDFSIASGESFELGVDLGESVVVSENVPPGWVLADVSCEFGGGIIVFADEGNDLTASCVQLGEARCVFTNVLLQRPIPTLSAWGMIAAAGGLVLIGVFFAIRKRRAQAF